MPLIDQQKAIDALSKLMVPYGDGSYPGDDEKMAYDEALVDAIHEIEQLPPVQPKTGHWVHDGTACYCSECKKSPHKDYNKWDVFSPGVWILSDFCPHCGADMRGEQDEY